MPERHKPEVTTQREVTTEPGGPGAGWLGARALPPLLGGPLQHPRFPPQPCFWRWLEVSLPPKSKKVSWIAVPTWFSLT